MSSANGVEVSIEKVSLLHPTVFEAQGKLKSGPSQNVAGAASKPITGEALGKLAFTSPSSLVQCSNVRRQSFPNAASVSVNLALDPLDVEYYIFQPILTPITTTDEVLRPDKRKIQPVGGTKQATAASIKSTRILSKFWGDEQDTDMEPVTETESHIAYDTSRFLTTPCDIGKKKEKEEDQKRQSTPSSLMILLLLINLTLKTPTVKQ